MQKRYYIAYGSNLNIGQEELKKEYEEIVKELKKIEKRIIDTESGAGGSAVRQIGDGLVV